MSTTFYVYPGKQYMPTFRDLLSFSNQRIVDHLLHLGASTNFCLDVEIRDINTHSEADFNLDDKVIWNENTYAWFYIVGIAGGTDVYYNQTTELDKEAWKDELKTNIKAQQLQDTINKSMEIGYHWSFRRSAGQSGIINLSYGLIAASLAKITDGFIYSDDGAWDYSYFPALADDFITYYFKPDFTTKSEDKEWVKNCIMSIFEELR